MEYFFILNGVKQGPYNKEAIKKFVAEGVITRETVITFPDGREIPAGKLKLPFGDVENDEWDPSIIYEIPSAIRSIFIVFGTPFFVLVMVMTFWGNQDEITRSVKWIVDRQDSSPYSYSHYSSPGYQSPGDAFIMILASVALTVVIYLVFYYMSKIAKNLEKQNTLIEQLLKTDAGDSSGTKK